MKVFLAGTQTLEYDENEVKKIPYILESYYTLTNKNTIARIKKLPKENFLLDSGAFTFMNNFKGKVNWQEYIDRYADFINENDIKYFFELDIDALVGYEKVKEYRKYLERKTNKKCIPVWHKSRGLDDFIQMCKEYDYVSIGGIVIKEITQKDYKYFPKLIEIAHKNNCKIHGLGFTNTKVLHLYHFDSVDSTAYLSGGRFGQIHMFNGKYIKSSKPKDKRAKNYKDIHKFNLAQWLKFIEYARKFL